MSCIHGEAPFRFYDVLSDIERIKECIEIVEEMCENVDIGSIRGSIVINAIMGALGCSISDCNNIVRDVSSFPG